MKNVVVDEYPPFTLEKPRYNQVSYYITLAHLELLVLCLPSSE